MQILTPKEMEKRKEELAMNNESKTVGMANKPLNSKINFVSVVAFILGILTNVGFVEPDTAEMLNKGLITMYPLLVLILRTFFTIK